MYASGNEETKKRVLSTIDFMTSKGQSESGYYYSIIGNGEILDDSTGVKGLETLQLIRRSGGTLYFLLKIFDVIKPKDAWVDSAKRCLDAFVKLYKKYNQLGQYVKIATGEMIVGGTTCGATAAAALAKGAKYFGSDEYLETAISVMEGYYRDYISVGLSNGGPGDILSAPDSESAFGLIEACISLFEATRDNKYLDYAKECTNIASTWVVTYKYKFPVECEMKRLDINTVGSVFANVQNKHSAPGIATYSGDSVYKLYKYTNDKRYLELIKDIAYFIPQCVSTNERPIYTWDEEPKKMPQGYICERVNMSDWEFENHIGGVFYDSCWCEDSLILSFTELMCYDEMKY